MDNYKNFIGLGVAGNFALHLEQAGEIDDFKSVFTEDPNGPKGIFPFYIPEREDFLPRIKSTVRFTTPDGNKFEYCGSQPRSISA